MCANIEPCMHAGNEMNKQAVCGCQRRRALVDDTDLATATTAQDQLQVPAEASGIGGEWAGGEGNTRAYDATQRVHPKRRRRPAMGSTK
jgi:hypothetical protein